MIQKRYQYMGSHGIEWTPWFNYNSDNSQLNRLESDDKWQVKNKLRNEYRII